MIAAEQNEERYETKHKLEHKQAHCGQAAPSVQRVKVHYGLVVGANVLLGRVAKDETETDGRGGQHKENCVQYFRVDFAATLERAIYEHRLTVEKDESKQHERRVRVELLTAIVLPS